MDTQQKAEKKFDFIKSEFQELNKRQSVLISQIEEKLNLIIKLNPKQDVPKMITPNPPDDFVSSIENEFIDLRGNTNMLVDILHHLETIL